VVEAPGKLVLLGEYAVVDGAPAIVAAIDRGVRCTVTPGVGIETPGDDRFVRAALEGAPVAHYRFEDTRPVAHLPGKPGFGGSAAATVAAIVAAGFAPERAASVHAAVQGGGSGIDVFASLHGGVRRFPDGAEVPCPSLVAVWSGASASTGPRVARYLAWAHRERFVADSRALVDSFAADPVRALREAYRLLLAMAEAAGVDYDRPAFARITALAAAHGGAAKPSGAGGGDVAVALFPDPDDRAAFATACEAEGLAVLDVRVAGPAGWTTRVEHGA
jgi:phosphomevalonate kinase